LSYHQQQKYRENSECCWIVFVKYYSWETKLDRSGAEPKEEGQRTVTKVRERALTVGAKPGAANNLCKDAPLLEWHRSWRCHCLVVWGYASVILREKMRPYIRYGMVVPVRFRKINVDDPNP
jgi:hypothetical protein